jgi:hypothetical protein
MTYQADIIAMHSMFEQIQSLGRRQPAYVYEPPLHFWPRKPPPAEQAALPTGMREDER